MNKTRPSLSRRLVTPLVAIVIIAFCFGMAQYPRLSPVERSELAARFAFEQLPLAEIANPPPYKHVREVHPSLRRISAWVSTLGAAASLADLDGDGLPNDLCSIDPRTDLVTIAPAPGTGERYMPFVLNAAPLTYDAKTTAPMGAVTGDFNEDGLMDLMVYYWGRTPVLFLRRADSGRPGHRTALRREDYLPIELAEKAERWFTNGATRADLDGDGHLDLIIGNYFNDGGHILDVNAGGVEVMHEGKSKAVNGGSKHVFLWEGAKPGGQSGVQFREVPRLFDETVNHGWTLAMGAVDLDGDQLPEIYFGHDFGPDRLLHNRSTPGHLEFVLLEGHRRFTDPKSCVLGHDSFKGMGADFADVNGDGVLDIYISNIATEFGLTESHLLWISTGDTEEMKHGVAPYIQGSEQYGLSRSGWGWDCRLSDFDNDGMLEAIQAVGFVKGNINRWPELQSLGTSNDRIVHDPRLWPTFQPGADLSGQDVDPFFVRAADGRYYNIGPEIGITKPMVTKGIAIADVDGDGRLDFVLANQWEPSYFYHNRSPEPGEFLGLHLLLPLPADGDTGLKTRPGHPGADLNGRPAIGAIARVVLPDGRKLVGHADGGSGHSGRRSPDIHLGLGRLDPGTQLDVQLDWRDVAGQVQRTTLRLEPGWHTVLLGQPHPAQVALSTGGILP